MCEVIRHRGPDDEGVHVEPGVGLGMRRLSIIDLATGHQPIANEDGTVLDRLQRRDLQLPRAARASSTRRGHRFTTTSDTEVDRPRLRGVGPTSAFERLRGMFAFAHLGRARRTLLLARDRLGIKPLYYTEHDGRLCLRLGAEVAPRGAGAVEREIDPEALDHYLAVPLHAARPGHLPRRAQAAARARPRAGATDGRRVARYWDVAGRRRRAPRSDERRRSSSLRACCATRSGRTWSATCRSARSCPAASTRASSSALMAEAVDRAGQDLLDRLRRAGVRRARARARRRAALRHRAPRVRRATRRARRSSSGSSGTSTSRSPTRPAIPTLVRVGARAPPRHGRAVGRRRRRAVRRLRPLPAAPAGGAVRSAGAARARDAPPASRRGAAAARGARASASSATSRATPTSRYVDAVAFFSPEDRRSAARPRRYGAARRGHAGERDARASRPRCGTCRRVSRHDAVRLRAPTCPRTC